MSELSIAAQDVTKSSSDRSLYQQEFSQLSAYFNNVATKTSTACRCSAAQP